MTKISLTLQRKKEREITVIKLIYASEIKQGKWDYYYNKAETHITKINGMGDNWDKAETHITKINEKGNSWDKAETHITKINGTGDNWDKAETHITKINEMGDNWDKAEIHIKKINGMGDNWDKANIHYTKIKNQRVTILIMLWYLTLTSNHHLFSPLLQLMTLFPA